MLPEPRLEGHEREPVRILLLEDDRVSAEVFSAYLRRIPEVEVGLHVAGTLADAHALLAQGDFDLIVADLNLPDSEGTATIESLTRAVGCPVIAMTSDQDQALRAAAIACGAYDFLQKSDIARDALTRLVRLAAMQARTFRSLRESEARFRSLTELSSDWYWEQDEQLRLTFMSSIEELGLDPSKFLGRKRWDQPAINLTEADWDAHRTQLERHEPFRDFEMQRAAPDGGTVWLSLSGEPVFNDTGRFMGYRGVGRDITQRKQTEREVRHLGRMYSALSAANEAILRARSPQEVFDKACEIAVEAGGFQLCTVFTVGADAKTLARVASSGMAASLVKGAAPVIDESQPDGGGLLGEACRTGLAAISNDYQSDARTQGQRERVQSYRPGSGGAFPLHTEGRLAGVFALQHAERGAFSDELTALLQRLTDDISFALDNFQREARRLSAEQELRESEERFRSLTVLSSDIYWEQDEQYRFTKTSGTSPNRLRGGLNQMMGKRRWDQHYFNMTAADWAAHQGILDARQPFRDLELGRVNEAGEAVWIGVSGEPVFVPSGAFTGYRGVGKDITARKREERLVALEHTVTRFLAEADSASGALEAAMQAVCETQGWECGRYLRVDERAGVLRVGAVWGIPTETIQRFLESSRSVTYAPGHGLAGRVWQSGQPLWLADVGKDSRAAQISLIRELGLRGAVFFPMMVKDKMIGILAFNSREVREPEERLLQTMRVIGSQIGQFVQRKQAEDVVRESEARFRSLTNLSSDWYWEQDAAFRFTKFEGKGRADGRRVAPSVVLGRCVWDLDGVVQGPIDWDQHRAQLQRHESFRHMEYSYRTRSGKRYYISADGEPVFDEEGRLTGYRGTSRDITQQRRGEQELRRFRAAMDMSIDAIYLVDRATMRFLDVNAAACRGVGYSREQLLGMGPQDLLLTPKDELERDYDAAIAAGAEGTVAETSYVAKSGRKGWTEMHRRALRADDNWIIVSISRDITERRLAEQRQAGHLRHQERIARFGQSALARREPAELIDEAVQTVLEALAADAVAYLEPGPGDGDLVLRSVVGVADAGATPAAITCRPEDPLLQVFQTGAQMMIEGAKLPFAWAQGLRSGALIPVRGERGVRGALCVCFRHPSGFAAEELNFAEAVASVLSTGLQRIDSEGRLAFLAQFDPLTGLPNRALLSDRFSQMIVQAQRRGSRLGVLFIDLDEFKIVNDTLGHAGGDDLLKEVAVRLQSTVRQGDTVARISGDEFAAVLADLAQPEDAALVAQKIIDRLAAAVGIQGQEVFVTASIGIATFPEDGGDAETLIGAADAAMYRAKQSGRNAYHFFTAEINQRSRARAHLGTELRRAVEREEFALVYQPKYNLTDREICGAEALLRWKHPERGTVSPLEFIPVLEETGLIVQVGEWVLRRACEDLKAWQAAGLQVVPVAVNLSARQFRQQDLAERIKALVRAAGVAHALIELEITESQLMQDPNHAIRVMRSLCDAGMRIAIDDFGTGYSSLSYLTRFPVSSLKIDRSFVADVNDDPSDAAIVRTIIEMAHTLGFTVVAEGIETEAQAEYLQRHGCEQAQGFLFARPMPAGDFAGLLAKMCAAVV